jgi:hypothetical protein
MQKHSSPASHQDWFFTKHGLSEIGEGDVG